MAGPFDYFVVFAEMRTGSNFLETNINAFGGLVCHGEAFNPHFIGYPDNEDVLGLSQAQRDENPKALIDAIRGQRGVLGGFRFFHDHDPRVLDMMLDDPRCAKIILTRNPLDSYVSWKIAVATGQWKLTNVNSRKEAKAHFDREEFGRHVEALQDFQVLLLKQLQHSGQTAFYLAYEDLQDVGVMNGLAKWLGVDETLESLDKSLKPQNPASVLSKVANPNDMIAGLSGLDRFNLTRTPNFEPRRGPAVPTYVAAAVSPLIYLPVRGGPEAEVATWLAAVDGVGTDQLITRANQKHLRQWKRAHGGHRSFTVLRHPALRAHHVFCTRILSTGPDTFSAIRNTLRKNFKLPIPQGEPGSSYSKATHREAFEGFLKFVRANLSGQTGIRVDAHWGSQAQALSGFGELALPDMVLREDEMATALPPLAERVGARAVKVPGFEPTPGPFALDDIYDDALEALVSEVYQRDYLFFGFGPWRADKR
ncbi:MAG: nodulation protein NodH [Paracoccaceae bacterium]